MPLRATAAMQSRLPTVSFVRPDFKINCKWRHHTWSEDSLLLVVVCDFISSEVEFETFLIGCPIFYSSIEWSDCSIALLGHGESRTKEFYPVAKNIITLPSPLKQQLITVRWRRSRMHTVFLGKRTGPTLPPNPNDCCICKNCILTNVLLHNKIMTLQRTNAS